MSSFPGRMKEYPTISLDRFDRENLHARAYFLSHCHKDHMRGLKGPFLKRKLKFSRTVKLYCSFVTKELLLSNPKYGFWDDHIVALELDSPTQISLVDEASGESEDVVVTLLTAGHCPGSVMFLIEGGQGTVLYTGDFRLAEGDASRIELLHSGSRVKDIQSVYLDSTFYDPRFYQIPSREACLSGIRELVTDWVGRSVYHVVWLNCKAAYGYEYLFTNLGEEFNTQIHVNSLAMFKKMPEILSYVTTERSTQIHACRHPKDEEYVRGHRLPCGSFAPDGTPLQIISIKPSTMWFGERSRKTNVIARTGASSYRACFSFHSSYSEVKDFLAYLNPVNIHASVVPIGRTHAEVTELLKPMCRDRSRVAELTYRPLGVLKRTRVEQPSHNEDGDDWLFEGTDLAPVRKKPTTMTLEAKPRSPPRTAPPGPKEEEHPPLPLAVTHTATGNFLDCTESNDEGDEEETEETEEGKGIKEEEGEEEGGEEERTESVCDPSPAPPRWDEFFTTEMLPDSQNSLSSQARSSCLVSPSHSGLVSPAHSGLTGSQTPELFGDDDDEEDHNEQDESSHTTSPSNQRAGDHGLSQVDTVILQPEEEGCRGDPQTKEEGCRGDRQTRGEREESGRHDLQGEEPGELFGSQEELSGSKGGPGELSGSKEELFGSQEGPGELSGSQASSDFEIPCTPESQTPQPDELTYLYRKLAAGEEVVIRKGSQGSM